MLAYGTICHMDARHGLDIAAIGDRLLKRREELRLDQKALAEKAGVSRAYISRLERGAVPAPKITELSQVAGALDMTLIELIRQPAGTRTERYSAECADLMAQLEDEPPELADAVISAWRQTLRIVRFRDVAQNN